MAHPPSHTLSRSDPLSKVDSVKTELVDKQSTILACIDGSNVTQSVCDYAAWYASKLALSVTILHVITVPKSHRHDLSGAIGMDSRRNLLDELTQLDEHAAKLAYKHGEALVNDAKTHILNTHKGIAAIHVKTQQRHGKLLPAIQHFAHQTAVIVMGRRGEDHQDNSEGSGVNLGSQIETVVRVMHQPILLCSEDFTPPNSYMLAYDGSPTAEKAVQMICDNDLSRGSRGYLVMVGHQDSTRENSLYKAQKRLSNAGLEVSVRLLDSKHYGHNVVRALIKFREENDISMIIIGAYSHAKWRRFFVGSTTTELLTKTRVPVLLLH